MAIVITDDKYYSQIADAIRATTQDTENFYPEQMPDLVIGVYESGRERQEQEFWDVYQQNGNRTNYTYGFYGVGWTDENFKPKYPIKVVGGGGQYIMRSNSVTCSNEPFEIDISEATNIVSMLYQCSLVKVGNLDTRSATSLNQLFQYSNDVEEIGTITLKEDGSQTFDNAFTTLSKLRRIFFVGVIGQSVSFRLSPLDYVSIENIMSVLSDTTTGKTLILNLKAVNKAFETSEGANDGSASADWNTLVGVVANWTISLV